MTNLSSCDIQLYEVQEIRLTSKSAAPNNKARSKRVTIFHITLFVKILRSIF